MSAGENIRWESIALGWLVALPAGLLLGPLLRGAYDVLTGASVTPGKLTSGLVIVSVVTGFLAYLFGGYVAGRFARRAGGVHGAMTAVLGVAAQEAKLSRPRRPASGSQDQHAIPVAVEAVSFPDRFLVCTQDKFPSRKR